MKTGITKSLLALGFFGIFTTGASAAYFDNAPAPRCGVSINRTLQSGSEGVDVSVLQDFLNRSGLLSVTPNGHYGPATTAAVRAFQARNYIPATGTVGPTTLNAINERMCDTDLQGDSYDSIYMDAYYGYNTGVTYVDAYDPYVKVISPAQTTPTVYPTPQNTVITPSYTTNNSYVVSNPVVNPVTTTPVIPPATTNASIASTQVIYSPSIGYTYGITPQSGSLTITTPIANALYNEGDTVYLSWTTNNLNATAFNVVLENISTNQSRIVTTTSANNASFTLTKELLDTVCSGACDNSQQGNFRIAITTPVRDIAGNISTLKAAVAPVTIRRPLSPYFGTVSITASKMPVNSGEIFKLYVNIPTGAAWNANLYSQYSFKIRANCPSGVSALIAGVPCGQDFVIPFAPTYFQSEIPVSLTNTTWFQQNVTFTLTVTNLAGQVIGTSQVNVTANQAPFNWNW